MSALEQSALHSPERRRLPRHRVEGFIPITIGRGRGSILDLSQSGMRIRHSIGLACHSLVRVAFQWQTERFAATAEVIGSRMISLSGGPDEPAEYETRVHYRALPPQMAEVLARILAALQERELRRWVANLRGWPPEPQSAVDRPRRPAYIRCQRFSHRWEKKWTREASQPEHGFVLPATVEAHDVERLCAAYDRASEEGRNLMRLIAAAVIREW
jgi:hypothetical protein